MQRDFGDVVQTKAISILHRAVWRELVDHLWQILRQQIAGLIAVDAHFGRYLFQQAAAQSRLQITGRNALVAALAGNPATQSIAQAALLQLVDRLPTPPLCWMSCITSSMAVFCWLLPLLQ